ncbi:MAG: D-alanine--D-alanine ligase, partial [Anaerolineae bacterium]|nr:D-alanine--D-alanine ligase [Anaerolineae bacterium]
DRKLNIGVIFGSRSVEHDVSIVTATQVIKALHPAKYNVIPIYIARDGIWYTGPNLTELKNFTIDNIADLAGTKETHLSPSTRYAGIITPPVAGRLGKNDFKELDVAFPVIHGSHGEDGTLQGLFEMANLPYVGAGVLASAIANDKVMTKTILKASGLPVLDKFVQFTRREWLENRQQILEKVEEIGFPAFVKPVTLGSSIGIARVEDRDKAALHIDIAANLDRQVLVEQGVVGNMVEINCAVMGNEEVRASTLEQPVTYEEYLTFGQKYMGDASAGMKSQERIIPAPLDDGLTLKIKETAVTTFKAIRGRGTARIDFLLSKDSSQFWVNEINTLPGSLAFYLWEPEGLSPTAICDELIQLALDEHREKRRTTYDYKSGLIELAATRGAKGLKAKV